MCFDFTKMAPKMKVQAFLLFEDHVCFWEVRRNLGKNGA